LPAELAFRLRLVLDPAVVTSTMVELGFALRQNYSVKAIAVSKLDSDLLNACLRLPPGVWKTGQRLNFQTVERSQQCRDKQSSDA
jgi:hypothetical protein